MGTALITVTPQMVDDGRTCPECGRVFKAGIGRSGHMQRVHDMASLLGYARDVTPAEGGR